MEMLKDVKAAIYHGQKNQQSGNHPNEQFKIFIHAASSIIPPAPGCKEKIKSGSGFLWRLDLYKLAAQRLKQPFKHHRGI